MVKLCILAATLGSVAAFSNPSTGSARVSTSLNASPITNVGNNYPETMKKAFDPLGLNDSLEERGIRWFQAAEIKHGRVAMVANMGWIALALGWHFPGMLSSTEGISFADVAAAAAKSPMDAIGMVPESGLNQILFVIGAIEGYQEMRQPHYILPGGNLPGDLGAEPQPTGEAMEIAQAKEVKNGRLAMIGIASYVSETLIPGSVPGMPAWLVHH